MFCSQCGTKNETSAKFCSSCGKAIAAAAVAPPLNQSTEGSPTNTTSERATAGATIEGKSKKEGASSLGAYFPLIAFLGAVLVGVIWLLTSRNFEAEYSANCTKTGLQTASWCACVAQELDGTLTREQKDLAIKGAAKPNPSAVAAAVGMVNPTLKASAACTQKEKQENFAKLSPAERCKAAKAQALEDSQQYLLAMHNGARGQSVPGLRESEDSIRNVRNVCGISSYSLSDLLSESKLTGKPATAATSSPSGTPTLAAAPARADWVKVAESDTGVFYIDPATIRKDGNRRRVWEIEDLKQRGKDGVMSFRQFVEYDCRKERSRVLSTSEHSDPMAGGRVLGSESVPEKWVYIAPEMAAQTMMRIVCAK